ncbi:hypothetical protein Vi05172_g11433 [Venturia inaequalis]|nr:hypothetical protein Vi05172_g11433 [Venturia inaequalis]
MKFTLSVVLSALSAGALAAPAPAPSATATAAAGSPKLLICSDSTTCNYAASRGLQGWGFHIPAYLSIPVLNLALGGRSTRSFIAEGRWDELLDKTAAGDFVLIEMGHNDDTDPTKGGHFGDRGTLPGLGEETKVVTNAAGTAKVTVHTFGWYLRTMIADVRKKNAIPIISGMVPRDKWSGNTAVTTYNFTETARQVAAAEKVQFVDHTKFSVAALQKLGPTASKKLFPNDNTHTNDAGAIVNAETFVQGAVCAKSTLAELLSPKGKAIKATC